jgi:hypothetical protein
MELWLAQKWGLGKGERTDKTRPVNAKGKKNMNSQNDHAHIKIYLSGREVERFSKVCELLRINEEACICEAIRRFISYYEKLLALKSG